MTRLHAGLDVSDETTAVCVVDGAGATIFETTVATTAAAIAAVLKAMRRRLKHAGLESETKSAWLYAALKAKRLPAVCLDARHTHAALSVKPNKTDKNDARGIAILLSRGMFTTAHVKSLEARKMRLLLRVRKTLQRKAVDLASRAIKRALQPYCNVRGRDSGVSRSSASRLPR